MPKRLIILFSVCLTFIAWNPGEETQENIRRKVELLSTVSVTIGDERIHCIEALPRFYESRTFMPAWSDIKDAKAFIETLRKASTHGLNPKDYHIDEIDAMLKVSIESPTKKAELDLLLTDAFLLYTTHMMSGKVQPETIDPQWHVRPDQQDPVELLNQALEDGWSVNAIDKIRPKSNTYSSLKSALVKYKALKENGGWQAIPDGKTLKPGMSDDRIIGVKKRLIATGDLSSKDGGLTPEFDAELEEAVRRFQHRHGIDSDGNVGKKTLTAMNVSVEERIDQIHANMERWRWLNFKLEDYRIMVNIADYHLEVIKNSQVERVHRVMVGKPYRSTPIFWSTMQYLVLNPTWTVPPTILRNDIIPAVRKDPNYLNTKGIQVIDGAGKTLDPAQVDWQGKAIYGYTYRQPAGKTNALGAVKFMFPNSYNVYLHDTPSKNLFAQTERAFSSGCIRVEQPIELAKHLLANDQKWSAAAVDKVVAGGKTETIGLTEKPAVYILYWTAWTDSSGVVQFRNDVYERDQKLIEALKEDDPQGLAGG